MQFCKNKLISIVKTTHWSFLFRFSSFILFSVTFKNIQCHIRIYTDVNYYICRKYKEYLIIISTIYHEKLHT